MPPMSYSLILHPDSVCVAIKAIDVVVQRHPAKMVLQYTVLGAIDDIVIPSAAQSGPAERLWEHTCCEIFIWPNDGTPYYELNFSPSTQWAAYRFDAYRFGMRTISDVTP